MLLYRFSKYYQQTITRKS